jgi:alpha-amylase/alpha-mannosidase (GH57 family)
VSQKPKEQDVFFTATYNTNGKGIMKDYNSLYRVAHDTNWLHLIQSSDVIAAAKPNAIVTTVGRAAKPLRNDTSSTRWELPTFTARAASDGDVGQGVPLLS